MVRLENLTRSFTTGGVRRDVVRNLTATFPTGVSVALLGRNGVGKSTLLKMIAGTLDPERGRVRSDGTISWPVGFAGSFHPDLTGAQNTRFVARVYGVDTAELTAFVADFAELGAHFTLPVRTYSAGMKSRLSFGLAMGIPFDTYLVDEVTSVGDAAFREKSKMILLDRLRTSGAIVVSHGLPLLREICTAGAILSDGRLAYYDDVEDAIERYAESVRE